jgi:hypothetical protein
VSALAGAPVVMFLVGEAVLEKTFVSHALSGLRLVHKGLANNHCE